MESDSEVEAESLRDAELLRMGVLYVYQEVPYIPNIAYLLHLCMVGLET